MKSVGIMLSAALLLTACGGEKEELLSSAFEATLDLGVSQFEVDTQRPPLDTDLEDTGDTVDTDTDTDTGGDTDDSDTDVDSDPDTDDSDTDPDTDDSDSDPDTDDTDTDVPPA